MHAAVIWSVPSAKGRGPVLHTQEPAIAIASLVNVGGVCAVDEELGPFKDVFYSLDPRWRIFIVCEYLVSIDLLIATT